MESRRRPGETNFVLGTINLPPDSLDVNSLQTIVRSVISTLGDAGRDATVMSRTSEDGASVDVHINLGQVSMQNESHYRIAQGERLLRYVNSLIDNLDRLASGEAEQDSPSTSNASLSEEPVLESSQEYAFDSANLASAAAAAGLALTRAFINQRNQASNDVSNADTSSESNNLSSSDAITSNNRATSSDSGNETLNQQAASNSNSANRMGQGFASNSEVNNNHNQRNVSDNIADFSNLLAAYRSSHNRFQRHYDRFLNLLSRFSSHDQTEIQEANRMHRLVSKILHHFSHITHLLSDLHVNFSNTSNRRVNVHPSVHQMNSFFNMSSASSDSMSRNPSSNVATDSNSNTVRSETASTTTTGSTNIPSAPRFTQSNFVGVPGINQVYVAQAPFVMMTRANVELNSSYTFPTSTSSEANNQRPRSEPSVPRHTSSNQTLPPPPPPPPSQQAFTTTSTTSNPSAPPPLLPVRFHRLPTAPPPSLSRSFFDFYLPCNSIFSLPDMHARPTNIRSSNSPMTNLPNSSLYPDSELSRTATNDATQPTVSNASSTNQPHDIRLANNTIGSLSEQFDPDTFTRVIGSRIMPSLIVLFEFIRQRSPSDESQSSPDLRFLINLLESGVDLPNGTIGDVLFRFTGAQYVEGESIGNDFLMRLLNQLTFQDIFRILLGDATPLNSTRDNLIQYTRETIFHNEENVTDDIIDQVAESIINEWQPTLNQALENISAAPGINIIASINNFFKINFRNLFRLLLNPSPAEEFGNNLISFFSRAYNEFFVLCDSCLAEPVQSLCNLVLSFVRIISSDFNPLIQEYIWLSNFESEIENILRCGLTREDVRHYMIRTDEQVHETPLSTSEETMDYESIDDNTNAEASPLNNEMINSVAVEQKEANSSSDIEKIGAEEPWRSSVPREWTPIVREDIQKQRLSSLRQRPFSDAYLNGLPKKKRKQTMSSKNLSKQSPFKSFSVSLQEAINSTRSVPLISERWEEIGRKAIDNDLHVKYEKEVDKMIYDRLKSDNDYNPTRFTSIDKVFKH